MSIQIIAQKLGFLAIPKVLFLPSVNRQFQSRLKQIQLLNCNLNSRYLKVKQYLVIFQTDLVQMQDYNQKKSVKVFEFLQKIVCLDLFYLKDLIRFWIHNYKYYLDNFAIIYLEIELFEKGLGKTLCLQFILQVHLLTHPNVYFIHLYEAILLFFLKVFQEFIQFNLKKSEISHFL